MAVSGADELVVRGHLHPGGYGGAVLRGSIEGGFVPWTPPDGFAAELEQAPPLPEGCAF